MTPDNRVDGAVLVLVDINDLKRSEFAIASAREYSEDIIATMREPLVVLDADLRVETVNRAFYRTFEATPPDVIGRFIYELGKHQFDIPELRTLLEEVLPHSHTVDDYVVESEFAHLGRRTLLLNARRMHSAAGDRGRIVVAIEDVTARKRAEEAQARLAAIVASSDDAIVSKDLTGVISSWNKGAERLFGYSAEEAIGQPITSLLIPEDRLSEEHDILARIRRGEAVEHFNTVRRRKNGTQVDVSVTVSPIQDPAGTVVGASKVARDITQRKAVEDAIRDSEERYRTLFDLGPVAVYSIDAAGVIQAFNRRAVELWGREPALGETEPRFCGSFKLFLPDGSFMPREQTPMAAVVAGTLAELRDAEVIIERPDGTRVTVIVNIRPLKNHHGQITGAINCFYDITERKQIEEALRDADRRKNEFLAMLAHELRNPLAPILVSIEILRRAKELEESGLEGDRRSDALATSRDVGDRRDQAVDVLHRQASQMVRLVDDLLDAGRISRGKIDLRRERVELSSVVYHAVDAARPISDRREQELTVTLPSAPVYLDADPTRLGQIIGNLLNNACKFTERSGHVWLTVESEVASGTDRVEGASVRFGPHVVIRIRDTGIGIAADQLEHIFEMFTQVDTSLERSLTGLGIGLTLVKTLTEMHGGTVEVHSGGAGQGSEFVVRLPVAVEAEPPSYKPVPARSVPTSPLRILIVDDNHDSADMVATLLQFSGHETFTAHDGLAAVEAAARLGPDVILLDIGLPILNGYEAARRIREQQGQRRRPLLIALTGWGQDEDRCRSEEAGFDAHLVKPVDHAVLGGLLADLSAVKQEVPD